MKKFIYTTIKEYLKESIEKKILYHGSNSKFDKFKDTKTFFSETKRFAVDYADQKAMDFGIDADTYIYTVELTGNIFDINNKVDYDRLESKLPDKIKYTYNDFGFDTEIDKEEYLLNLKGFDIINPLDDINDLKVGDKFPNPEYKPETYQVHKIDDDYVYAYLTRSIADIRSNSTVKYSDENKNLKEFLKNYFIEKTGKKYCSDDEIPFIHAGFQDAKYSEIYKIPKPSETEMAEYKKLLKQYDDKVINTIVEKGYIDKFNKKPIQVELKDTWRFYENNFTDKIIKDLGYCGYIALEKGVKTYCIYHPNKSAKIIDVSKY